MNRTAIDSHRNLAYGLFGIFETLLLAAVVVLWSVNPRRMSGLDDAAGITFYFSLLGLSIMCWLLRRSTPRLAVVGFITALLGFVACTLLPAVP